MQAFNPYLPSWEYIPDGEPRVFGDRVYLYGSHDRFGGMGFCLNDYVCWSAPVDDLARWQFHGTIFSVKTDPFNQKGKHNGYAPDCVQGPDGRYYLFYALHMDTVISVAVCDTPAGQYRFYGHVHFEDGRIWGRQKGDPNCFDPGVLVDDDGSVYLYVGFSPAKGFMRSIMQTRGRNLDGSWCVRLAPDMLTIASAPQLVVPGTPGAAGTGFAQHPFFEASSPRRYNGIYYFVYSSQQGHELCYATAAAPMGPYTYRGVLHSNGDIGADGLTQPINYTGNNHGGLLRLGDKYYIFGHRQTNQSSFCRQGVAEPLTVLPDGGFAQARMTSCGLNGGPLAGAGKYPAYIACALSSGAGCYFYTSRAKPNAAHPYFTQTGPDREGAGDQYIANMQNGSWAGYRFFDIGSLAAVAVTVRGTARGTVQVRTQLQGPVCCSIPVTPGTDWHSCTAAAALPRGEQALYFTFCGTGAMDLAAFTLQTE